MSQYNEQQFQQNQNDFGPQDIELKFQNDDNVSEHNSKVDKTELHSAPTISQKYSTPRDAHINLLKGKFGSGILALPHSFSQVGIVLSTVIFIPIALAIFYSMQLLFRSAESVGDGGRVDYPQLARKFLGIRGMYSVKVFICVLQLGCVTSYVIFFLKFFESAFETEGQDQNDLIYLLIAFSIIIPLSLLNNMQLFVKYSFIGNILAMITILAVYIIDFIKMGEYGNKSDKNAQNLAHFSNIPLMIGVSIYAFEAIGIMFHVRNSLEDTQQFFPVLRNVNIIIVTIYISFSICGSVAFGKEINEIILFSLDNNWVSRLFQITYALCLIISYPVQILPAYQIIEEINCIKFFVKAGSGDRWWKLRRILVRTLITLMICWTAYFVPRFSIFLNIIGAFVGVGLQFFIPILIYNKIFRDKISKPRIIIHYIILLMGTIGSISAISASVVELIEQRTD